MACGTVGKKGKNAKAGKKVGKKGAAKKTVSRRGRRR